MSDKMALKIAIDLMHVPSQVRFLRSKPLPDGMLFLLRIAAGDVDAECAAVLLTERSRDEVRQAATFFIEQILFAPNANSYRVLGASQQASAAELRQNVALLLRWLHPDLDSRGERSLFIGRVTAAWNDVKTPERRAAYDKRPEYKRHDAKSASKGNRTGWPQRHKRPFAVAPPCRNGSGSGSPLIYTKNRGGFLRRALFLLFHIRQQ